MLGFPAWLFKILTFPGVMFQQVARMLACHVARVPVNALCLFTLVPPIGGYLLHDEPKVAHQYATVALLPALVSGMAAFLIGYLASQAILGSPLSWLLIWLGVSVGSHVLPERPEIDAAADAAAGEWAGGQAWKRVVLNLTLAVLAILSHLRLFWIDLLLGFACTYAGLFAGLDWHPWKAGG